MSRTTILNYLSILEATHLVYVVRPYHGGNTKEIVATPCVYGFDTGFVAWAQGLHEIPPKEKGFMWEHLVLNEIAAVTQHKDIMHWRDKQGHEVDFVIEGEGKAPLAIEAKWNADAFDPDGLQACSQYLSGANIQSSMPDIVDILWFEKRYQTAFR
ncbi:MAG: DUF4143 domain-containing protein, partial [Treponema sp.]|nr:DUF4143 domain-containing protein [Treponema sp.]